MQRQIAFEDLVAEIKVEIAGYVGPEQRKHGREEMPPILWVKSQFLCKLTVDAHRLEMRIEGDRPENTWGIETRFGLLWPDHACELVGRRGKRFPLIFEFDMSTERLESTAYLEDAWTTRNAKYNDFQDQLGKNYRPRVVPVTVRSRERLENILALFARQTTNNNRQLYLGVFLDDFLSADIGITAPLFADHVRPELPLIPPAAIDAAGPQLQNLQSVGYERNLTPCLAGSVSRV